ncbi:uncharacterized protein METZ01_LOCUS328592, partial [marine metagenome]
MGWPAPGVALGDHAGDPPLLCSVTRARACQLTFGHGCGQRRHHESPTATTPGRRVMLGNPGTGKHAGVDTMSDAGNRVLAGKVADDGLIEFPIQGHVLLATGID